MRISAIPSHVISPDFYYEFVIYANNNASTMNFNLNPNNYFWAQVNSVSTLSSYSNSVIPNQNFILINKYQTVYPISLNSIYILTREASATNSLFLSFTVNVVGVAYQYMEFEFDNLGLSNFQITNGDIIPCYLHTTFATISGKNVAPLCRGYANGLNNDSPLIIRVEKFASFTTGTNFKLAFDQFSNPAIQTLYANPINVRVTYFDRTNIKTYTANYPSVYISDSLNRGVPSVITSGTLTVAITDRGASTYH